MPAEGNWCSMFLPGFFGIIKCDAIFFFRFRMRFRNHFRYWRALTPFPAMPVESWEPDDGLMTVNTPVNTIDAEKSKGSKPARIAVTGGIGSGKSLVCDFLAEKGLFVLSADDLSRLAVEPGTEAHAKIAGHFGDSVLMPDNTINRPALRRMISTDPEARKALESFIHPEVFRQMAEKLAVAEKKGEPLVVVEVPLLYESGFDAFFDGVILVRVDTERRIERIMSRDNVSREDAIAMMNIQMPDHEKSKRADFIVDNNGSEAETRQSVERLYESLLARSRGKL